MSRYTWLKTFETFNRICSECDKEYQGIDDLKCICTECIESRLQNTPIKFIGENNPYYKGNNKTYRPDLRYKIVWPSFYIWGREDLIRPHLGAVKKYIKTLCYAKKDINKVDCDKTKNLKRKSRFSGGAYDYESQSESNIIKNKKSTTMYSNDDNKDNTLNFDSSNNDMSIDTNECQFDINSMLSSDSCSSSSDDMYNEFNINSNLDCENLNSINISENSTIDKYDQEQIANCDLRYQLLKDKNKEANSKHKDHCFNLVISNNECVCNHDKINIVKEEC